MTLAEVLGNRVRDFRLAGELTQSALAELADMTSDEVSRIERGAREPRFQTLERLAEALGVEASDLLPREASGSVDARDPTAYDRRLASLVRILDTMPPELANAVLEGCGTFARAATRVSPKASADPR